MGGNIICLLKFASFEEEKYKEKIKIFSSRQSSHTILGWGQWLTPIILVLWEAKVFPHRHQTGLQEHQGRGPLPGPPAAADRGRQSPEARVDQC